MQPFFMGKIFCGTVPLRYERDAIVYLEPILSFCSNKPKNPYFGWSRSALICIADCLADHVPPLCQYDALSSSSSLSSSSISMLVEHPRLHRVFQNNINSSGRELHNQPQKCLNSLNCLTLRSCKCLQHRFTTWINKTYLGSTRMCHVIWFKGP